MNGLAIGVENGVYAIGIPNGNDIDQIQPFQLEDFVVRGTEVAQISPKVTTLLICIFI